MSHFQAAERQLALAAQIEDSDRWYGDRDLDVARALARAQVHATLALADTAGAAGDSDQPIHIHSGRVSS